MITASDKLSAVDLFAGAGGFSYSAIRAGIDVRVAVELNPHACRTYRKNLVEKHPGLLLYENNIMSLSPMQLLHDLSGCGRECDILLGGPPCQGFSVHRIKGAGIDDPRNELVLRYFHFVEVLRPKVFLMENVPGMLWPRHHKYLEAFYKEGRKAGYTLHAPVILDARDYGVPQRRKRVFVLGVRKGVDLPIEWPPSSTHCNPETLYLKPTLKPWRNAQEIFDKPISVSDPNNCHMKHSEEMTLRFMDIPLNGGSRKDASWVLPCHQTHNGHKDVYGRIDPTQPGPTMTTACINPSKGRFVHPTEHHGITARHAARFQTFPDDFIFEGGLIASGVQIGNAVPIDLGVALLSTIKEGLQTQGGRC